MVSSYPVYPLRCRHRPGRHVGWAVSESWGLALENSDFGYLREELGFSGKARVRE